MVLKPFSAFLCCLAGAIGAFAVWVSIESLLSICIVLGMLGFLWVLENKDFLRKSFYYSLTLFIVTCINMVIERPLYDLTTAEFDRLSIV